MARGSIQKRPTKDGAIRYRVRWETAGPNGERVQHSETVSTRKEADALLLARLAEARDGFGRPATETVAAYLDRWQRATAGRVAAATQLRRRSIIAHRIVPRLGAVRLDRLSGLAIQSAWSDMLAAGYARSTVEATHALLNTALAQAVAWRLIPRNPAGGVEVPRPDGPPPTPVWTAEEAARFLRAAAGDPDESLWRFLLDSGCRLGEALALRRSDLDLGRGVATIRRTVTKDAGGARVAADRTKTRRGRSVPLTPETVESLRSRLARPAAAGDATTPTPHPTALVWPNASGGPRHSAEVGVRLARACRAAGVPRRCPRDLRHTCATLLLAAGVHPKVVQERLGHATVAMTLDRYSHLLPGMQQSATAALSAALSGRAGPARDHGEAVAAS